MTEKLNINIMDICKNAQQTKIMNNKKRQSMIMLIFPAREDECLWRVHFLERNMERMTLDEMAKELGVSKSTVSRALSGKGRIGVQTRQKIQQFAKEHESGRVEERQEPEITHNLGVSFPDDIFVTGNQYFFECLLGIYEAAALMDYNVLITTGTAQDFSGIQKFVEQKKVDGMIVTRSLEDDKVLRYLSEKKFPTGVTGLCDFDNIIQVDTDNEGAADMLTSLLIGKGYRRFALILEDMSFHVNRSRYEGFCKAILKNGLQKDKQEIYTGKFRKELLNSVIVNLISKKVECVICGDDVLAIGLISQLLAEGYRIPRDIAIASLYNSSTLNRFVPAVTAVDVSARMVGNVIGKQMIRFLQGKEYQKKTMLDYEILIRASTYR